MSRYRFFTTKYVFTNKEGEVVDTYKKWRFLSEKQIESVVKHYTDKNCFYSIQTYDKNRENKECPLYFDLDGVTAKQDAMDLVHKIKKVLGVYPEVWNSGSKGYHVMVPVSIAHPKCERIAKFIALSFNPGPSFDPVVYKTRNMWRVPNTINQKSGKLKVQINNKFKCDMSTLNKKALTKLVESAKIYIKEQEEKQYDEVNNAEIAGDFETKMLPCIENLITKLPPEGVRHSARVLIARFFRTLGIDMETAIQYVIKYPHYREREKAVRTVFKSIYTASVKPKFGCGNEEILKSVCCKYLCVYASENEYV